MVAPYLEAFRVEAIRSPIWDESHWKLCICPVGAGFSNDWDRPVENGLPGFWRRIESTTLNAKHKGVVLDFREKLWF
ncbi:hypothetical protein SAMN04489759_103250 [Sulfitobacter delicatus]|uniref:Uncharacterized protein n=1 Tax=Sulfitobacter delicatus TaxID=218672 RepID=A0A1G7P7S2_9RHOB|nr:hypothetical protein SAMN04489759_103250 [Sulfitobacter delicatus]